MNLMPEWTERAEKRGLDPLGMQNAGVQLYQTLVPGISNVTLRVRYYGLFCWASEAYAHTVGSTDMAEWRQWIRRLEALHSLVAHKIGSEGGVAGIDWAGRTLAEGESAIDFTAGASTDPDADKYLRQSLGVFGQAYLSQMVELGLFSPGDGDNHSLPVRTERGLAFANAFARAIGPDCEKLLIRGIQSARVSLSELDQLAGILPSRIAEGEERELFEQLLFARGTDATDADRRRRDTLLLILFSAGQLGRRPRAEEIRSQAFADSIALPARLQSHRLQWEAYQAQDMWQVAAAALLSWAIAIINAAPQGRFLSEIHAEIETATEQAWPGRANMDWQTFREASAQEDSTLDEQWRRLMSRRGSIEERGLAALEFMAALDGRIDQRADLAAEIDRSFSPSGGARSIRSELHWFNAHQDKSLAELAADYVIQRVTCRHTWVATQKLRRQRDYTFLFEARDGRLAYRAQYDPVTTTPRLEPAIQFLVDIRLIDGNGLTVRGTTLIMEQP